MATKGLLVNDGVLDYEKFKLLLTLSEQQDFDRKLNYDLDKQKDRLSLVKDIIAMCNGGGGYILIGQDDKVKNKIENISNWKKFDSASLRDYVKKYVSNTALNCIEIKESTFTHNEKILVLIYVTDNANNLPIPFNHDGQYLDKNKRNKFLFHKGQIIVRRMTQNCFIEYEMWDILLNDYREIVKVETMKNIDDITSKFLLMIKDNNKSNKVNLSQCYNLQSLYESLNIIEDDISLNLVLPYVTSVFLRDNIKDEDILSCFLCCSFAAKYNDAETFEGVLKEIKKYLDSTVFDSSLLPILCCGIYILGSQLVRSRQWDLLYILVNLKYDDKGYIYDSWLRFLQVQCSRTIWADTEALKPIPIIPSSCNFVKKYKYLFSDINVEALRNYESIIVTSMCQFDLMYCYSLYSVSEATHPAYPASLSYSTERICDISKEFANDNKMRNLLCNNVYDERVAEGLSKFNRLLLSQPYGIKYSSDVVDPCLEILMTYIN